MTNKIEDEKVAIEFAPGCFDNFEGTQEELDEMIADIHRMFESGELAEHAVIIDIDELFEEDPEAATAMLARMDDTPRMLQ